MRHFECKAFIQVHCLPENANRDVTASRRPIVLSRKIIDETGRDAVEAHIGLLLELNPVGSPTSGRPVTGGNALARHPSHFRRHRFDRFSGEGRFCTTLTFSSLFEFAWQA